MVVVCHAGVVEERCCVWVSSGLDRGVFDVLVLEVGACQLRVSYSFI